MKSYGFMVKTLVSFLGSQIGFSWKLMILVWGKILKSRQLWKFENKKNLENQTISLEIW
jgi:hypothetical protein